MKDIFICNSINNSSVFEIWLKFTAKYSQSESLLKLVFLLL